MGKNSATKVGIIVVVLLFFVYGIIGIPHSTGKGLGDSFKQALARNIKLGLDLQGGIHLVLGVHVDEAIGSATDRDVARLETELPAGGITGATVGKPEANSAQTIVISAIPPAMLAQARTVATNNEYAGYDVTSENGNSLRMVMKGAAIKDLQSRTLEQSIETIRERIDKLGVSEPVIQKYGLGENEILGRAARYRQHRPGKGRHSVHLEACHPRRRRRPVG